MAKIPKWWTKKITHQLANQGIETTPDEVEENRKSAYATIKHHLGLKRITDFPEGDLEFLLWMRKVYGKKDR